MNKYLLYQNRVNIFDKEGNISTIFFNENSGKVYYRYKINSLTGIKHPGIFLGVDLLGTEYFLHNHYHIGRACLVNGDEFKQGMPIEIYNETCTNSYLQVIEIALNQLLNGESYNFLSNNCQTFTNVACHNKKISEDVSKWRDRLILGAVVFLGFKLLASE